MIRNILLGLDGSPYSDSAIELGIRWAGKLDAMLVGLGIVDEPTIRRPSMVPIGASWHKEHSDDVRVHRARLQVEQFLEQFTLRCTAAGVASKLLEDVGWPDEKILLEAQRFDLILLGKETHFHFETQDGPCETLTNVLKNSPRPVVTATEKVPQGDAVLVAYDGSLQAAKALHLFAGTGLADGCPVHVVSIHDEALEAARIADRAHEFLRAHGIRATAHPLKTSGHPARLIQAKAEELHAALVVMGAYGKHTLRDFFVGSVTKLMLRDSRAPLFLYH